MNKNNFRYDIVPYTRGCGLQIISDQPKLYEHFALTVDENHKLFTTKAIDFIVAYKTENVNVKEWCRVIKDNGYLVLYQKKDISLNHKDYVEIINQQIDGYHFQIFQRSNKKQKNTIKTQKTACVVRYGGFGDMIQMSSILPGLKGEGYHITVNTSMSGYDIVKNDPHIDDFLLQDKDQVPNNELGEYWEYLATKFDKLINLSESVEGTLLAIPGRIAYSWPHALRHEMLDINYLEFLHKLAQVPLPPKQKFYATVKEKAWAQKQYKKINADCIILWVLSGSSVHKAWPYLDEIIARLLLTTKCKVVLTGDEVSQVLETGWENEPRVIKTCGKWAIRETLAFAERADIVIGPETGVLNAVGQLKSVAKIICLSHSSKENLSKHWENCISLTPKNCSCYPCHRMNFGFNPCIQDKETGVALCQAKISPEQMWSAIKTKLEQK